VQVVSEPADWTSIWLKYLKTNKTIGLVPTMGALHEGHLDLVNQAKKECDIVIVSIFVNPTQFNNSEDFANYPVTISKDLNLLERYFVDVVFLPSVNTMYPDTTSLTFDFGPLERILEGAFRPGHFNGVGIIVSKLFNHIRPHRAYFGQKDLQQVAIIRALTKDLSFPIELIVVPTKRDSDGLAMSSRNLRLSPRERKAALILPTSLTQAKNELLSGRDWLEIQSQIKFDFEESPLAKLEYFELVHTDSVTIMTHLENGSHVSICVAAYIGTIRLIDNLPIIY
jgi:pantoate--beta-alanine ligase